jgi:MoxR-like ATPase
VAEGRELAELYDLVADVHVDASLERYILDTVRATRSHPDVSVGASPRGSLALYKTAQALAAVRGRDYVAPDDVKEMAALALPHRLILRPESQLRGRDAQAIIADILDRTDLDIGEAG